MFTPPPRDGKLFIFSALVCCSYTKKNASGKEPRTQPSHHPHQLGVDHKCTHVLHAPYSIAIRIAIAHPFTAYGYARHTVPPPSLQPLASRLSRHLLHATVSLPHHTTFSRPCLRLHLSLTQRRLTLISCPRIRSIACSSLRRAQALRSSFSAQALLRLRPWAERRRAASSASNPRVSRSCAHRSMAADAADAAEAMPEATAVETTRGRRRASSSHARRRYCSSRCLQRRRHLLPSPLLAH